MRSVTRTNSNVLVPVVSPGEHERGQPAGTQNNALSTPSLPQEQAQPYPGSQSQARNAAAVHPNINAFLSLRVWNANAAQSKDHNNHTFFGRYRKDKINGVSAFSAQIGKGEKLTNQQRQEHQTNVLQSRMSTYLDTLHTPAVSILDKSVYIRSQKEHSVLSFNENTAFNKLKRDFERFSTPVREHFIGILQVKAGDESGEVAQHKLKKLLKKLQDIQANPEKISDLETLQREKERLQNEKHKGGHLSNGFLLTVDKKLNRINRKIAAIEYPSSYEKHIANNGGEKVTNHPQYVTDLRSQDVASRGDVKKTKEEIREFAKKEFDGISDEIRTFMASADEGRASENLCKTAHNILYRKHRAIVHQFIRDNVTQLERAGVSGDEFDALNKLIPSKADILDKVQSVIPGMGKQMRLQDEAVRMEKALPIVLSMISEKQTQLRDNLMWFNLTGVSELSTYLSSGENTEKATDFVKSRKGKAFVDSLVKKLVMNQEGGEDTAKSINEEIHKNPPSGLAKLKGLYDGENSASESFEKFNDLINENQHLFMETSDPEFWDRYALGISKLKTPLHDRVFKEGRIRAAALGIPPDKIDAYFKKGIENTLRNRSMGIQSSKLGGQCGAAAAHLAVDFAAWVPGLQVLLTPGFSDGAMAVGYTAGIPLGAMLGNRIMGRMKNKRLEEAKTQTTDFGKVGLGRDEKGDVDKARLTNTQNEALTGMSISRGKQFTQVHGSGFRGIAKAVIKSVATPLSYGFLKGPKHATEDLILRRPVKWGLDSWVDKQLKKVDNWGRLTPKWITHRPTDDAFEEASKLFSKFSVLGGLEEMDGGITQFRQFRNRLLEAAAAYDGGDTDSYRAEIRNNTAFKSTLSDLEKCIKGLAPTKLADPKAAKVRLNKLVSKYDSRWKHRHTNQEVFDDMNEMIVLKASDIAQYLPNESKGSSQRELEALFSGMNDISKMLSQVDDLSKMLSQQAGVVRT